MKTMSPMKGSVNFPKALTVDTFAPENSKFFLLKTALIDGEYYYGHCRNSKCAKWSAARDCFTYMRFKFGTYFAEEIKHPSDDNGFDLFVPLFVCYPEKTELLPEDQEAKA